MGRYRPQNHITSEETWKLVNPVNKQLLKDFIEYWKHVNSGGSINGYNRNRAI